MIVAFGNLAHVPIERTAYIPRPADPRDLPPRRSAITELHRSIRDGPSTSVEVVLRHIDRVRATKGVTSMLATSDAARLLKSPGSIRGGAPLRVRTQSLTRMGMATNGRARA